MNIKNGNFNFALIIRIDFNKFRLESELLIK